MVVGGTLSSRKQDLLTRVIFHLQDIDGFLSFYRGGGEPAENPS
jgi:hypothetical protein